MYIPSLLCSSVKKWGRAPAICCTFSFINASIVPTTFQYFHVSVCSTQYQGDSTGLRFNVAMRSHRRHEEKKLPKRFWLYQALVCSLFFYYNSSSVCVCVLVLTWSITNFLCRLHWHLTREQSLFNASSRTCFTSAIPLWCESHWKIQISCGGSGGRVRSTKALKTCNLTMML